jgi:hypothetical protein
MESSVEIAPNKTAVSKAADRRKRHARSRVSNGRDVLPNTDGRSFVVRRYRDIANAIFVDQGGEGRCSESRKQLIRRFAAAAVIAEQMESRLANGGEINISEHAQLASTLVRIAQRIGINRRAKDITPALPDYLDAAETEIEARNAPRRQAKTDAVLP